MPALTAFPWRNKTSTTTAAIPQSHSNAFAHRGPEGNESPPPEARKEEEAFTVTSRPEGFSATPVYLRWGSTFWEPGTEKFQEEERTPFLDLWGGWGWRHVAAKHGWNPLDRFETEVALAEAREPRKTKGGWEYTATTGIEKGVGGVKCERHVIVDYRPIFETEIPRGIVSSYNSVLP